MSLQRRLIAADGYCDLGMPDDALREISKLDPAEQRMQAALEMKLKIAIQFHRWELGLGVCAEMRIAYPEETLAYVHGAYCLHALGRTADAKELLLAGPPTLLHDSTYYYNLGCYDAVLGNFEEARDNLLTSFRMNNDYREWAKIDPDLKDVIGMMSEDL